MARTSGGLRRAPRGSLCIEEPSVWTNCLQDRRGFLRREVAAPVSLPLDDDGSRKDSLIESVAKAPESISHNAASLDGQRLCELHFDFVLSGLRIELGDSDARLILDEEAFPEGSKVLSFFAPHAASNSALSNGSSDMTRQHSKLS